MTKYEYTKKIMERVDILLLDRQMMSTQLSLKTGIHITMLSRFRTGERVLGAYHLHCIADALGVSVNTLTGKKAN